MFKMDSSYSIKEKFIRVLTFASFLVVIVVSALSYTGSKEKLEATVEKDLKLLSESIYQSMTNSMLAGNPQYVIDAENNAKKLDGVEYLNISKSKQVIKDFASNESFTNDPKILEIFENKKNKITETTINGNHEMMILKPFVAEQRCIQCHTNAKVGDVLGVMELRASLDESDKNIASFTTMIVLSNVFMAVTLLVVVWVLLNMFVSNPLKNMIEVVKSLASGDRDLTKRIPIESKDDLGLLSEDFNNYLQNIEENSEKEKAFINEAKKSIEKAKHGWYRDKITANAPGKTLGAFKDSVNEMIETTHKNFKELNGILEEYKNHDYTKELKVAQLKEGGAFYTLVNHINGLRSVITSMLIENKENGLKLDESSDILLENMDTLNHASSVTESSLEDVNGSLKLITDNISQNTQNISKMSSLTNDVTQSSQKGESLASKTVLAMEDINTQVADITEAIEVIDQIAFQTNILSLNAAVEAATAGEAGKGFAVVASEVRNLAAKSAEAAEKIKELVESATKKTNDGKDIAYNMIEGYKGLNGHISKAVEYFTHIEEASKEQLEAIDKINNSISKVTNQIKSNIEVTKQTKEVAVETDLMAKYVVSKVDEKEFVGKDSVTI